MAAANGLTNQQIANWTQGGANPFAPGDALPTGNINGASGGQNIGLSTNNERTLSDQNIATPINYGTTALNPTQTTALNTTETALDTPQTTAVGTPGANGYTFGSSGYSGVSAATGQTPLQDISDLYRDVLGRTGDDLLASGTSNANGLIFWANQLANGTSTLAQIKAAFMDSAEYKSKHPNGIGIPNPVVTNTGVTTVPASTVTVTPEMTAAGQFNSLIASNNPLMQQARTRALEQMNDRGLINSSMALTAGDQAAYNAALPLAQQDASMNANVSQFNAGQKNQFGLQNNQQVYTKENMGLQQGYTQANMALQHGYTQANMGLNQGYTRENNAAQQANTQANMNLQGTIQQRQQESAALFQNLQTQTQTASNMQAWANHALEQVAMANLTPEARTALYTQIKEWMSSSITTQATWFTSAQALIRGIFNR